MSAVQGPAERLVGLTLKGGWKVIRSIARDPGSTGQSRSACYCAEFGNQLAFVKAIDFRWEDKNRTVDELNAMTAEFINERSVHEICREERLTRVTSIIDAGTIEVDGEVVHYLICEFADRCLREIYPPGDDSVRQADRLLALRHVSSALEQLHGASIAHQDVKLSNVVRDVDVFKLTDLGSSSCKRLPPAPHDLESFAGQPAYAPYELLYGERSPWEQQRLGCDIFLLGNLAFTSFVGNSITYWVMHCLPAELRPFDGHEVRFSEVLPNLMENHGEIVPVVIEQFVHASIADEFLALINTMCHPDPTKRGHPKNLGGSGRRYGLERYTSKLNRMAAVVRKYGVAA